MAIFRKRPIAEDDLLAALTSHKAVIALQKRAPVDVAACLMALALVESNFDVLAEGDHVAGEPKALGLWQFNIRVHAFDGARLEDVGYQIEWAAKLMGELVHEVEAAAPAIRARKSEVGVFTFDPARDVPNFFNVGWQFGSGTLRQWITGFSLLDLEGFVAFRNHVGRPLGAKGEAAYRLRSARFRARYEKVVADAPRYWAGVVEDAQAVAGGLSGGVFAATLFPVESALRDAGAALAERVPAPLNPISKIKELATLVKMIAAAFAAVIVLGVVLLIAFAVWELRRARSFTRETLEPAVKRMAGAGR